MSSSIERPLGRNRVVLAGDCTLKAAISVKDTLKDGLEVPGDVVVDGRAVERLDTSVLQLLVAFVRDMQEAGRAVTWIGSSEELDRSARLLGLRRVLGLAGDDPA